MSSAPTLGIRSEASIKFVAPENFRALKWNEVVRRGDFIAADPGGYEPWQGPIGFRADAYVKTIYRKQTRPSAKARNPQ